jgi:hypothetical protein
MGLWDLSLAILRTQLDPTTIFLFASKPQSFTWLGAACEGTMAAATIA